MSIFDTLNKIFGNGGYNLMLNYQENEDRIRKFISKSLPLLDIPFSVTQRTLTIYYPYVDQLIPVTYQLPSEVTPKLILQSISNFYQQDLSADQIAWLVQQGDPWNRRGYFDDKKAYEVLGSDYMATGLKPHNGGWLVQI